MADNNKSKVLVFALTAFLLLAVLFGMQIMTFIFGNLGVANELPNDSFRVNNESGAWLNSSGYALANSNHTQFGNPVILNIVNTSGFDIDLANVTVTDGGIVTNTTNISEGGTNVVNISYTYTGSSPAEVISITVNNRSLQAISNYSDQAGIQFTVIGIAITLAVLILLFIIFWEAFMGNKGIAGRASSKGADFG